MRIFNRDELTCEGLPEMWDEYARAGYQNAYRIHTFSDIRSRMENIFLVSDSGVFLDAGCGAGGMFETIAAKIRPKELWGADWSQEMLNSAQKKIERLNDRADSPLTFKLYKPDFSKPLPWPNNTFDGVISQVVICYLPYGWKEHVKELHRVIKPGGACI